MNLYHNELSAAAATDTDSNAPRMIFFMCSLFLGLRKKGSGICSDGGKDKKKSGISCAYQLKTLPLRMKCQVCNDGAAAPSASAIRARPVKRNKQKIQNMEQKIDCFLPEGGSNELEMTIASLKASPLVGRIVKTANACASTRSGAAPRCGRSQP